MSFGLKQSFGRICKKMPDFIEPSDFAEEASIEEWESFRGYEYAKAPVTFTGWLFEMGLTKRLQ